MKRRTKTTTVNGKPILPLPKRIVNVVRTGFLDPLVISNLLLRSKAHGRPDERLFVLRDEETFYKSSASIIPGSRRIRRAPLTWGNFSQSRKSWRSHTTNSKRVPRMAATTPKSSSSSLACDKRRCIRRS